MNSMDNLKRASAGIVLSDEPLTVEDVDAELRLRLPLVSVAIVSYNHSAFVGGAIESVLSQDYPNVEIVVADDASTDGTAEVLAGYVERFPGRVRVIVQPHNVGITTNCNAVLGMARGEYIAFLGSDDLMLPGKLCAQVEQMEADPSCVLSYHDLDVFQSETDRTLWLFSKRNAPREGRASTLIRHGCFNGACSTMLRASAMPKGGFDERISHGSDWLFWIRTAENGKVRYIDRVLGRYRRHGTNVTGDPALQRALTQDLLATMMILLADKPDYTPEISARTGLILLAFGKRQSGNARLLLLLFGTMCCIASGITYAGRAIWRIFSARRNG